MSEPVRTYVRTRAGRYHLATTTEEHRFVNEACNLDDAPGEETEVTFAELEAADEGSLCARCFPREGEA